MTCGNRNYAVSVLPEASVTLLKGVGNKTAEALSKLGIKTLEDLLFLMPRRYEDRRQITRLCDIQTGEKFCAIADVISCGIKYNRTEAIISDGTANVYVTWFSSRIGEFLKPGMRIAIYAEAVSFGGRMQITHPEFEILRGRRKPEIIGVMLPVYPGTSELTQRNILKLTEQVINKYALLCLREFLPEDILRRYKMMSYCNAVKELHRPRDDMSLLRARNRLAFDELFLLQTGILMRRNYYKNAALRSISIKPGALSKVFNNSLPFSMTVAQKRVIREVLDDLKKDFPMNRLLQGDVGSGKTLVAFTAILAAVDSGVQSAFMAPTEILATQHYINLQKALDPLGIKAALLTGSLKQSEKNNILDGLTEGSIKIVIGTHAIFTDKVNFKNLGLIIIDEQHRFGVLQRNALTSKGNSPHVLSMTATPIPRTIIMTVYGDLEVSVIDKMPPGRKKVKTISLMHYETRIIPSMIREHVKRGHQVYWVCPTIEQGERGLSAVTTSYENLKSSLPELRIKILHGQMSGEEKADIMNEFSEGKIDVLVSTVIIEVGVDVPNATLMIIQDAGQFGLAQLHQLRGRIGRGSSASVCVLMAGLGTTPEGLERIDAMTRISDGFELSEIDLNQRGPGEVCGVRQHGVTDFRVADLVRDYKVLLLAKREAEELIKRDPELKTEPLLKRELMRRLGNALELATTA